MAVKEMPEKYVNPMEWHPLLRPVVSIMGAQHVWDRGLAVLDYPPTFIDTEFEAGLVKRASLQGA